jgi:cytochrome P450
VSIDVVGLHHNEKIWENPDQFDPDRWSEERIKQVPNIRTCYMPFSIGSRNCIGKIFTHAEVPLITVIILKQYNVEFADGFYADDVRFDGSTSLKPHQLKLKFISRSENTP